MRGASASATRAQWAGYEAPDEKEDEWPIVSLPSEMIHEYGSRRVFDFSLDADRAILGFRPLPREEADSLSEEMEGVIGRLANPERLSKETLSFFSRTSELHTYDSIESMSLPASSPSPPDTPLPGTPSRTRAATPNLANDLFAAYMYDSPVVEKTIKSTDMARHTHPLTPPSFPTSIPKLSQASSLYSSPVAHDLPLTPSSPTSLTLGELLSHVASEEDSSQPPSEVEISSQANVAEIYHELAPEALPHSPNPDTGASTLSDCDSPTWEGTPTKPSLASKSYDSPRAPPSTTEAVPQSATEAGSLDATDDGVPPSSNNVSRQASSEVSRASRLAHESPVWSQTDSSPGRSALGADATQNAEPNPTDHMSTPLSDPSTEDIANTLVVVTSPASVVKTLSPGKSESVWPDINGTAESILSEDQEFSDVEAMAGETQSSSALARSQSEVSVPSTTLPEADGITDEPVTPVAVADDALDTRDNHDIMSAASPAEENLSTESSSKDELGANMVSSAAFAAPAPHEAEAGLPLYATTDAADGTCFDSHTAHTPGSPRTSLEQSQSIPHDRADLTPLPVQHAIENEEVSGDSLRRHSDDRVGMSAHMPPIEAAAWSQPVLDEGSDQPQEVELADTSPQPVPSSPPSTTTDVEPPQTSSREEWTVPQVLIDISDDSGGGPVSDESGEPACGDRALSLHRSVKDADSDRVIPTQRCAQPVVPLPADSPRSSRRRSVTSFQANCHAPTPASSEASRPSPVDAGCRIDDSAATAIPGPITSEDSQSVTSNVDNNSSDPPTDFNIRTPLSAANSSSALSPPGPKSVRMAPEVEGSPDSALSHVIEPVVPARNESAPSEPSSPVPSAAETPRSIDSPEPGVWVPSVPMERLLNYKDNNVRHSLSDAPSSPTPSELYTQASSQGGWAGRALQFQSQGLHLPPKQQPNDLSRQPGPTVPRPKAFNRGDPEYALRKPANSVFQQLAFAMPGSSRLVSNISAIRHTVDTLADPDSPLSSYQPTYSEKWYSLTSPQPPQRHSLGIEINECTLSQPASPAPEVTESLAVGGGDATEEAEADSPVLTLDTQASSKGYPIRWPVVLVDKEANKSELSHQDASNPSISPAANYVGDVLSCPSRKRKETSASSPADSAAQVSRGKRGKFTNVSKRKRAATTSDVPLLIKEGQEVSEMPEGTEELDGVELVVASPPSKRTRLGRPARSRAQGKRRSPSSAATVSWVPEPAPSASSKRRQGRPQTRIQASNPVSNTPPPTPGPAELEQHGEHVDPSIPISSRSTRSSQGKRKLWSQKLEGLPPSGRAKTLSEATASKAGSQALMPSSCSDSSPPTTPGRYWTPPLTSLSASGAEGKNRNARTRLQTAATSANPDPDEEMATAAHFADEDTTKEVAPTAQLRVQEKSITTNRLWSEEEIQFCADFWFKSQANNPEQNPGQGAGLLCVEAMKQAGYTRSLKGVLSRFARFARHKKLDQ